jgi:hypothetical protein
MKETLKGYFWLLSSLFFGVAGCFNFLQSLHDFLLMWVQVEPLSQKNLRLFIAFEGQVSSTDSIKYFHTVGFNLKYQLTLVDTFLVFLHFEIAEWEIFVWWQLELANCLLHISFSRNFSEAGLEFGKYVFEVDCRLDVLLGCEMLNSQRFQRV